MEKTYIQKNCSKTFQLVKSVMYLLLFVSMLAIVLMYKILYLQNIETVSFWYFYTILAGGFLISRLPFAYSYDESEIHSHHKIKNFTYPKVSIIIAAKDEEKSIFKTIEACMKSAYPAEFECIAVDDGSSDLTLSEMKRAAKEFGENKVKIISFVKNKGKREAMAEGILIAQNEIIVFVDSDSFVKKNALRLIAEHFNDITIGAVSGNTKVANHSANLLTKMQSIRYATSYDLFKSSESLFGVVTCCPGCFSAYRKSAIMPILPKWRTQKFMGTLSTFGDDRSLTNFVLKKWKVTYCQKALAQTLVPELYFKFLKQQLRWKKSWIREGFVSGSFMWKKNPIASVSFYLNLTLPVIGPFVVGWVIYKTVFHFNPLFLSIFILGLITMGLLFSLYLRVVYREKYWYLMPLFSLFYTTIMIWQMPYAFITINRTHWGTR